MRALVCGVVLGSLLGGCMAAPEAEELVLLDEEHATMPELQAIPFDERAGSIGPPSETAPETEPAPEPGSPRASSRPRFVAATGPEACWGVDAVGFPAIAHDGTTVVVPRVDHVQLSYNPGVMSLERLDAASGEILESQPIVVHDATFDEFEERACGRIARGIRRRAHAANTVLASGSWRAMERLPVSLYDATLAGEPEATEPVAVPATDRAVQLVARHGEAILRIPGVKVLERHPLPSGEPFAVYGDRATGTVLLVTQACAGDSCTCDPSFIAHVLHWSPETFATIDARPCTPSPATGPDDEPLMIEPGPSSCEPVQYEFSGGEWSFG